MNYKSILLSIAILTIAAAAKSKNTDSSSLYQLPDSSKLEATIMQTVLMEEKTMLILNKGSKHNVKLGDTGIVTGEMNIKFTITNVYPFRSQAIADYSEIFTSTDAVINLYTKP